MTHSPSLIALLCIGFVVAFALGLLAQRLRLSPLVGYLLAGVIAGPFTPGFVGDASLAPQLADVGVILLMFGVGLHFSMSDLLDVKRVVVPGAFAQIAFTASMGTAAGLLMQLPTIAALIFGVALSAASTVVVMRAMEERRLLDTQRGRIAIGWLVMQDLTMVLALVLLPAVATALGGGEVTAAGMAKALGWTLLKVSAFVVVMLLVGKRLIPRILEYVAGLGSRELFTLGVLAIALGVAFGAAVLFDVGFALGAFFAGMLLNESELSHKAAADSLPMRDAFAVLFFVSVGMLFDPTILIHEPLLVLTTVGIIMLCNALGGYTLVRLLGLPKLSGLTLAACLAQIGEFSFILADLGRSQKLLSPETHSLILAGAILSIIFNPFLFVWLDKWQRRQQQEALAVSAQPQPLSEVPADIGDHAIVVGYGRVGRELTKLLRERGIPLVLVENDPDRVNNARNNGLLTVRGNAAAENIMEAARPETAHLAILAMPQALEAGEIIARLKTINPGISVLARAHSEVEVKHLLAHGADAAVLAERELAYSLRDMVLSTVPYRHLR